MGSDENLRKIIETPMKPMNYTWNLHLMRHEFSTEPLRAANQGQRKKDRQKGKEETNQISSLPLSSNQ
ncbi:hypothetical protein [Paenibacillus pabuli]|uniref:hypothetical protein n=1 Tax=Paenibacillus pabuli TaxID=1472 RepID=UPI001FFF23AE|nr:hypothetical protein [Paenibacillus pabuli]UPK44464.1 hypothetical protein KET34_02690 [Paenibacillus pabuli]